MTRKLELIWIVLFAALLGVVGLIPVHIDIHQFMADPSSSSEPELVYLTVEVPSRDEAAIARLKQLTVELRSIPGVRSVVAPPHAMHDTELIPVKVWTRDQTFGRFLVELEPALPEQARIRIAKTIEKIRQQNVDLGALTSGSLIQADLLSQTVRHKLVQILAIGLLIHLVALLLLTRTVRIPLTYHVLLYGSCILSLIPIFLPGIGLDWGQQYLLITLFLLGALLFSTVFTTFQSSFLWLPLPLLIGTSSLLFSGVPQLSRLAAGLMWATAVTTITGWVFLHKRPQSSEAAPLGEQKRWSIFWMIIPLAIFVGFGISSTETRVPLGLSDLFSDSDRATYQQAIKPLPADKMISIRFVREDKERFTRSDLMVMNRIFDRMRKHPSVFDVLTYPQIARFSATKRAEAFSTKNPVSYLSPARYLFNDGKEIRAYVETALDAKNLADLRGQLGDLLISQLKLGEKGLVQQEPDFSMRTYPEPPPSPIPLDFYEEVPEEAPSANQPPPPVTHLWASISSPESDFQQIGKENTRWTYISFAVGLFTFVLVQIVRTRSWRWGLFAAIFAAGTMGVTLGAFNLAESWTDAGWISLGLVTVLLCSTLFDRFIAGETSFRYFQIIALSGLASAAAAWFGWPSIKLLAPAIAIIFVGIPLAGMILARVLLPYLNVAPKVPSQAN